MVVALLCVRGAAIKERVQQQGRVAAAVLLHSLLPAHSRLSLPPLELQSRPHLIQRQSNRLDHHIHSHTLHAQQCTTPPTKAKLVLITTQLDHHHLCLRPALGPLRVGLAPLGAKATAFGSSLIADRVSSRRRGAEAEAEEEEEGRALGRAPPFLARLPFEAGPLLVTS